jgi:hypothetical protein
MLIEVSNNLVFDILTIFELIDDKNTIEKDVNIINWSLYLKPRLFILILSLCPWYLQTLLTDAYIYYKESTRCLMDFLEIEFFFKKK